MALAAGHISEQDSNRHFLEGIHHSLRRRIEGHMLVVDPDLDALISSDMCKVVKAVEHIYSKHQFDQHLLETAVGYCSASNTESKEEDYHKPPRETQY